MKCGDINLDSNNQALSAHYCIDPTVYMQSLQASMNYDPAILSTISQHAERLINAIRQRSGNNHTLKDLLQEYQLSTDEGLALMCLAEALLRVPDKAVAEQLIVDRIRPGNWQDHLDSEHSLLLNASTCLLMLGAKVFEQANNDGAETLNRSRLFKLIQRLSQPLIHKAMRKVIAVIAEQFVFAETQQQALEKISSQPESSQAFSLDMLGEAAITRNDADVYFQQYHQAIRLIGEQGLQGSSSVSIKLSALHPRYEFRHQANTVPATARRVAELLTLAASYSIAITIDAEEMDRLSLSLAVFSSVLAQANAAQRPWLGMAVQAYSTRAMAVLKYIHKLAVHYHCCIAVRLVRGAYWDSEIKQAQREGLPDYPVLTTKRHTDIAYLACAEYLLQNPECFYPQFATHNVLTLAHLLHSTKTENAFEFQRLHGMGEELYQEIGARYPERVCRTYCPVGEQKQLLAYLVRRLLENGANNSFLKQLMDADIDAVQLAKHPLGVYPPASAKDRQLPLPKDIYLPLRSNSAGLVLADPLARQTLLQALSSYSDRQWRAAVLSTEIAGSGKRLTIDKPYNGQLVGHCQCISPAQAVQALHSAQQAFHYWRHSSASTRAERLLRFADLLEQQREELMALLVLEAGKTIGDALDELREAADFARYYAQLCLQHFSQPMALKAIAGESNCLHWRGRGVFLCISPWNFPLAIFCGQVCAALAAGNCVLAKPANSTPLIAFRATQLLHEAGFEPAVLHFIPGEGAAIGEALCNERQLAGVAVTGSTDTAQTINQWLAARRGPIVPLIAETGGQNAMIADSSTLPEQLVKDVIQSAFYSAGQRCSALRVLYIQQEVYSQIIEMLKGAMQELRLGDPMDIITDIGPCINHAAKKQLLAHIDAMTGNARFLAASPLHAETVHHNLLAPHLFQIDSIKQLPEEHFGPVLHVIPFQFDGIEAVIEEINDCGYGLTLGIHSRNIVWARQLASRLNVGNIYINRTMVGAVVGAQPFGGQGLSGTGPKAGGPHYLFRFATETTVSNNLSAIGGNAALLVGQHENP